MSNMRYFAEELRKVVDPLWRQVMGSLRKVAVELTDTGAWRVKGYEKLAEKFRAEVFSGVGFYSRPKSGASAEAAVVFPGGAENGMVVATRDEGLRQSMVGSMAEDEAAIYNSQCVLYLDKNGKLHARSKNGTAVELALKSDVQEAVDKYNGHVHADPSSGTTGLPITGPAPGTPRLMNNPTGTTKLLGE